MSDRGRSTFASRLSAALQKWTFTFALGRKGGAIALEPANKTYETRIFPPERVKIQGCPVGLIRKY